MAGNGGGGPTVTVPVISASEEKVARGQYPAAVADAYHRVVLDLQRAYGLTLPAQWTHRQFLTEYLREDMGQVTVLVERLYRLYEPVRYGTSSDWTPGDLVGLLRAIYAEPAMRDLYRPGVRSLPDERHRPPAVGTDDPLGPRPPGFR